MGKAAKAVVIGAAIATGIGYAFGAVATGAKFAIGGTTLFSAGTVGAYFARSLVVSAIMGVVAKAFAPKPTDLTSANDLRGRSIMARNPIAAREIVYGQVKKSGAVVFMEATNDNQDLNYCVAIASHEITEINSVFFNDQLVNSDLSDGVETAVGGSDPDYSAKAVVTAHFGADDQEADANLVSRTSATADHRFRGIAYIYTKCTFDQDVFANGTPNVSVVLKGRQVFDPRTSTTGYSDNAALCIRDYLVDSTYGLGATAIEIDDDSFIAAANICDEDVDLSGGGTEKRYTINGVVDTSKSPSQILDDMLIACQGSLYYSNGQWHIKVGAYVAPTVTLDEDDVIGAISIQTRNSGQDQFNAVKGVFVSPDSNWQATDFPEVTSTTFETEDGGDRKYADLSMPFTTSSTMAQRIAKMSLYRNREQLVMSMPCKLTAFQFEVGDTVQVTNERMGFSSKVFEVVSWNFDFAQSGELVVNLTLKETSSAIYAWDESTDEQQFTFNNTTLPSAFDVPAPGIEISDELRVLNQEALSALIVDVTSGQAFSTAFEVEARQSGSATYVSMGRASSNRFELLNVVDGVTYEVRARTVNTFGVRSAYVTGSHQVVGKTAPPSDVTDLTGNVINGALVLTWTPVADLDLSHYRLRYATATSGATYQNAVNLVQKIPRPSASAIVPARTGTYFIKAIDKLGLASETATSIVVDTNVSGIENLNVVQTINEHPSFSGVTDDTVAFDDDGYLILDTENLFDAKAGNFDDALGLFDGGSGDVDTEGFYYFANSINHQGIYTSRVTASMAVERLDYVALFDSAVGLFDSRSGDFDGDVNAFDDTDAELQVRHTQDDPTGSPTWSAWKTFVVGDYTAWGMEFRLRMTTTDNQATPKVTELSVSVDMADRVEAVNDIASGAGSYAVSFTNAFKATPAIGIAATMETGDYYEITSKSGSGFTITFKNSSGTAVNRTFDYVAKGYGRLGA